MQDLVVIHGGSGTGKSILAQIFTMSMVDVMDVDVSLAKKWCMYVDAKSYNPATYHELWRKVKEFLEAPQDKDIKVPYKTILVEDADTIPATHQNSMKTIMDKNSLKLKWIFTASEPRKFIQYLQTKGILLKTKAPVERDALIIVMGFCFKFKIGYEREGLRVLFDLYREPSKPNVHLSLSKIMNMLQKTFVKYSYVSAENVYKASKVTPPGNVVGPYASIEPFERCRKCTLYPPCPHRSAGSMIEQAAKQRDAYPIYHGENRPICPEFVRSGKCSIFNRLGRCTLAHPRARCKVLHPIRRCPVCTIVWPCQHCAYSKDRNMLKRQMENISTRMELLKIINVHEPPVHLITHLVDAFEDWAALLEGLAKFYQTPAKQMVMDEMRIWVDEEFSVTAEDYEFRNARLTRAYGEIVTTPLLAPRQSASAGARGRSRGESRQNHTAGGDDGSLVDSLDGTSVAGSASVRSGSQAGSRTASRQGGGSVADEEKSLASAPRKSK